MSENTQTVDQPTQNAGDDNIQVTEKTFTQEEVNGIVTKESRKAVEKLLKELGVEDIKNAKQGLDQLKALEDEKKTEIERLTEKYNQSQTALEVTNSQNNALQAQLSALKMGVLGDAVEDVVALAQKHVSEDVSMDDAIKNVLEKYPHFGQQVNKTIQDEPKKPTITVGGNPSASSPDELTSFEGMSYTERLRIKQNNPELFERLSKGAK